jgi:hypothetical protein
MTGIGSVFVSNTPIGALFEVPVVGWPRVRSTPVIIEADATLDNATTTVTNTINFFITHSSKKRYHINFRLTR